MHCYDLAGSHMLLCSQRPAKETAPDTELPQLLPHDLQILEGTVAAVCKKMDVLHRLINGIALLDVLQSFGTVVSCSPVSIMTGMSQSDSYHAIHMRDGCSGCLSC